MTRTVSGAAVAFSATRATDVDTDLLVMPVFEGEDILARCPGSTMRPAAPSARPRQRGSAGAAIRALRHANSARLARRARRASSAPARRRVRTPNGCAALRPRPARPRGSGAIKRIAFLNRGDLDTAAAAQAIAEGLMLRELQQAIDTRPANAHRRPLDEALVVVPGGEPPAIERAVERGRRPRRVLQHCPRALQRAVERADAVGVRRPRRRDRPRPPVSAWRFSTRTRSPGSAWACCWASRAAAPSRRALIVLRHEPAGRAGVAGARPGRQGHHVRHRRHLDQARRRHGAHEGRHGGRRRRRLRDARRSRCSGRPSASSASSPRPRTCPAAARSSRATS